MDIPERSPKTGRHRSDSHPATLLPTSNVLASSFQNLQLQSSPGSNNLYEYEPLERLSGQIRLLSIEPEDGTYTIATTLSAFSISESPPFTALSYAWGDYTQERLVMIDGRAKIVGQSCEFAFWQLRASGLSQWYLIDAICIDQSTGLEKGHQVQAMPIIFGTASQVAMSDFLGLLPSAAKNGDLLVRIRSQTLDSEFNAHVIVRRCGEIYSPIGTALLVPEATLRLSMYDELGRRR